MGILSKSYVLTTGGVHWNEFPAGFFFFFFREILLVSLFTTVPVSLPANIEVPRVELLR